ncbi:metallophosphoesterase [Pyrobaculum calidifontis]|uniref:Phosphoesterase n=1 Tax=Pyrobaculum calidifontis (strain DSM 21063 / JCM 11548 / VA1) TaxID=410359 RepID=A3MW35_PYRCJ|nr:metallophosphoesterase [Pyrobaculum calidifontis]ABO08852.1 phosphodiesterase, MJ0936 family [Pyrobaculum calidifontis JCM 11548]
MLVAVISDTHDDWVAIRRFGELVKRRGPAFIIHAGDWTSPFSLMKMRKAVGDMPIYTVLGNNEGDKINFARQAAAHKVEILGDAGLIEAGGRRIGVYHGTSELILEALIRSKMFDIVVYGHTHKVDIRHVDGTLVINPGEACGCAHERKTAAFLDLSTLHVEIVDL